VRMGMCDVLFGVFMAGGKVWTDHVIDIIVLWVWMWI